MTYYVPCDAFYGSLARCIAKYNHDPVLRGACKMVRVVI